MSDGNKTLTPPTPGGYQPYKNPFLTPEAIAAMISGGMGMAGGALAGYGQGKQSDADRQLTAQQMLINSVLQQQQQNQNAYQFDQSMGLSRADQAMQASQLNPLAQQESRQRNAMLSDMMSHAAPTVAHFDPNNPTAGGFSGGAGVPQGGFSAATQSFFTPQARMNAEQQDFQTPRAALDPNMPLTDLSTVGYGGQGQQPQGPPRFSTPGQNLGGNLSGDNINTPVGGALANGGNSKFVPQMAPNPAEGFRQHVLSDQQSQQQAYQQQRQQTGDALANTQNQLTQQTAQPPKPEAHHSSIWGKIGKIAAVAAPIVAAPFTGGASLALIGAGAGAAGAALNGGGVKGALMGAGLGAIPGLGGAGGAAQGVGESAGKAILRNIANPQEIAKLAGAALPGKAGLAANLVSNFLPGASPYQAPRAMNSMGSGPSLLPSDAQAIEQNMPGLQLPNMAGKIPAGMTPGAGTTPGGHFSTPGQALGPAPRPGGLPPQSSPAFASGNPQQGMTPPSMPSQFSPAFASGNPQLGMGNNNLAALAASLVPTASHSTMVPLSQSPYKRQMNNNPYGSTFGY